MILEMVKNNGLIVNIFNNNLNNYKIYEFN